MLFRSEHPRNGHDDHANVTAGLLNLLRPSREAPKEPAVGPIFESAGCTVPGGSSLVTSSAEVPTPPARGFLEACERFLAENRAAWAAHHANPTPPPAPAAPQQWDATPGGQAWHAWVDAGGPGFDPWRRNNG